MLEEYRVTHVRRSVLELSESEFLELRKTRIVYEVELSEWKDKKSYVWKHGDFKEYAKLRENNIVNYIGGVYVVGHSYDEVARNYKRMLECYFVEEFDGKPIYKWGGYYVPYWGCSYGFDTIEGCRDGMRNKKVAYCRF